MKKYCALLFVLAMAMAVMTGCGGSDSAPVDTVPRSQANYQGSELPAVLDTSVSTQNLGVNFVAELGMWAMLMGGEYPVVPQGSTSSSSSDFVEGGDGGSYTYSSSASSSWDATSLQSSAFQSLSFSDFADSRGVYVSYYDGSGGNNGRSSQAVVRLPAGPSGLGPISIRELQAGRGSVYRSVTRELTTDGIYDALVKQPLALAPIGPGPVGSVLTDSVVFYANYEAFYTSTGHQAGDIYSDTRQTRILQSGFKSADNMTGVHDTTNFQTPFEDTLSADYAVDYFYSYSNPQPYQESRKYTQGLLGFGQTHAWDLSTATFTSSGRYCAEGDLMSPVQGCVDFTVSLNWDHDATTRGSCRYWSNVISCYGWPESGNITLGAGGATASYAFTPTGGTVTIDAGDGSAPFETNLSPPAPN